MRSFLRVGGWGLPNANFSRR